MRFRPTTDQEALRDGVREVLARRFDATALRAAIGRATLDRALWRDLGAAGFFALLLPEAEGGVGLGLPEAVLAFEEAGRALLPGPLVPTLLAAGHVPGAATGETVVTAVDGGGLVEWLTAADVVLGADGTALAGPGTSPGAVPDALPDVLSGALSAALSGAVALRSVDPLTPLHRVPAAARDIAGDTAGGMAGPVAPDPVAVLLTAAEQLGTAGRACDLAAQHARTREQFGRPIGAFQAVRHLCADLLVRVEVARAAVYAAAVTAGPLDIAAARLLADEAAVRGARDCLQVHGGTGFTWEAEVHLVLKRAWTRTRRTGGGTQSEEELARALFSGPA
ncbi:acyl-CoA dehydrogenase family protein [Streptomyces sp. NPDC058417]|uniref:acyl-CoA dehydrogenase family protein n=1 Tax=unclassified Streptomyces TaxID=2593676 RepID=UPI00364B7CD8